MGTDRHDVEDIRLEQSLARVRDMIDLSGLKPGSEKQKRYLAYDGDTYAYWQDELGELQVKREYP